MARILVIDDDPMVRETVAAILRSGRHEVVEAGNGRQGLALFGKDRFDLVMCDILMPEMEGIETIRRLTALAADVRVIAMTGAPAIRSASGAKELDFLRVAGELGAMRTLRKPFTRAAALALVDECLAETPTAPLGRKPE